MDHSHLGHDMGTSNEPVEHRHGSDLDGVLVDTDAGHSHQNMGGDLHSSMMSVSSQGDSYISLKNKLMPKSRI